MSVLTPAGSARLPSRCSACSPAVILNLGGPSHPLSPAAVDLGCGQEVEMPWRGDAVGAACSRLPEEKLGGKRTHQTHPLQVAFGSPFVGGENHDGKLPSLQSEAVLEPGRACEFPGSRCLAKVTGARPKRQVRGPHEPLLLALLRLCGCCCLGGSVKGEAAKCSQRSLPAPLCKPSTVWDPGQGCWVWVF